jgi:hypothetical protein
MCARGAALLRIGWLFLAVCAHCDPMMCARGAALLRTSESGSAPAPADAVRCTFACSPAVSATSAPSGRDRCVSIFLDKKRHRIGKSQPERPPKTTPRPPHPRRRPRPAAAPARAARRRHRGRPRRRRPRRRRCTPAPTDAPSCPRGPSAASRRPATPTGRARPRGGSPGPPREPPRTRPGRGGCDSVFLDKSRRHIGTSQSKRPAKGT